MSKNQILCLGAIQVRECTPFTALHTVERIVSEKKETKWIKELFIPKSQQRETKKISGAASLAGRVADNLATRVRMVCEECSRQYNKGS
jgi:hypothetical protein